MTFAKRITLQFGLAGMLSDRPNSREPGIESGIMGIRDPRGFDGLGGKVAKPQPAKSATLTLDAAVKRVPQSPEWAVGRAAVRFPEAAVAAPA